MTEEKRWTLYDRIKNAREEMREYLEDDSDGDVGTWAHEIADTSTPLYTTEILATVQDDFRLATAEPELGPAFDGSPTPANIIAANIYERIYDAVMEEARTFEQEKEK